MTRRGWVGAGRCERGSLFIASHGSVHGREGKGMVGRKTSIIAKPASWANNDIVPGLLHCRANMASWREHEYRLLVDLCTYEDLERYAHPIICVQPDLRVVARLRPYSRWGLRSSAEISW
jgi:hypothetical protein